MVTTATHSYLRGIILGSLESGGLQCKGEGKLVEEGKETLLGFCPLYVSLWVAVFLGLIWNNYFTHITDALQHLH